MAGRYRRSARRLIKRFRRRSRRTFSRSVKRIAYSIVEKKYWDFTFNPVDALICSTYQGVGGTSANFLAAGWGNCGSLVACMQQGSSDGTRIGNRIHVKYVQLTMQFFMSNNTNSAAALANFVAASQSSYCRYMLILDKQPGGTSLPRTNMLDHGAWAIPIQAGSVTNVETAPGALRDYNMLRRFKVLLDMQHQAIVLQGTAAQNGAQAVTTGTKVTQHYIPVNRTFTYTSAGSTSDMKGAASVMQDNDLFLQVCPSMAACCAVAIGVRVCYQDC